MAHKPKPAAPAPAPAAPAPEEPKGGFSGQYNRHLSKKFKRGQWDAKNKRIYLLDEIRGFAILCMVFYHMFYTMYSYFDIGPAKMAFELCEPLQPYFAMTFIFISGIASRLSRNSLKRGVKLAAIAIFLSVLTILILPNGGIPNIGPFEIGVIDGAQIRFGILHCLSASMIIFSLIRKFLDKIPTPIGVIGFALLYVMTSQIGEGVLGIDGFAGIDLPNVLYETNLLMPLGMHADSFFSADYFPLLPNVFLFIAGSFVGVLAEAGAFPKFTYRMDSTLLSFLGRHSLLIYLLHQPVIFFIFDFLKAAKSI